MPKASTQTASDSVLVEGYEGRYENFDGGYTVAFETFTQDSDPASSSRGFLTIAVNAALGLRPQREGDIQDGGRRADVRGGRHPLRAPGPHACGARGKRGRRAQSDERAPADNGGRLEEHASGERVAAGPLGREGKVPLPSVTSLSRSAQSTGRSRTTSSHRPMKSARRPQPLRPGRHSDRGC